MVYSGRLNKLITIQQRVPGLDEYGGDIFTWEDVATVWARKRPLRGRELISASAAQSETTVMFYIRYIDGLDSSMRISQAGKVYDITSIANIDEADVELEISAKTGTNEG